MVLSRNGTKVMVCQLGWRCFKCLPVGATPNHQAPGLVAPPPADDHTESEVGQIQEESEDEELEVIGGAVAHRTIV
eukprot:3579528-Rhodomonas_salina.3